MTMGSISDMLARLDVKGTNGEPFPYSQHNQSGRLTIKSILGREDKGVGLHGQTITVAGWVKTGREQGKGAFAFLELNDGTCFSSLQVMVTQEVHDLSALTSTGTCVVVEGLVEKTPEGVKQPIELKATKIKYVGACDAATYPIAKGRLPLEFLRSIMHLRPRTNTLSCVARIRSQLSYATHKFFQEKGFAYVHTPIVTASDCEGAGEMFQVTTLFSEMEQLDKLPKVTADDVTAAVKKVEDLGEQLRKAKEQKAAGDKSASSTIEALVKQLNAAKGERESIEARKRLIDGGGIPRTAEGKVDYSHDFFARQAFLTVSGQLQVENFCCALSNVYTFGPTFRAENSNTTRHLAEFWMIEPELAFADLEDDMNCAEDYVRFCIRHLLEHCMEDMEFITKMIDKDALARCRQVVETPFKRISYTEAITLLEEHIAKGKVFENPVSWGIDLASEHERYITEEIFKQPTIVYNYPKDIKAFYMRQNEDGKTVAAMDLLVPKVGELIGGSQREERVDVLEARLTELGMPLEPYSWYLDLRRYGTCPHSGFGLGLERLILFATGLENIRDVIPFPRWPGHAEF